MLCGYRKALTPPLSPSGTRSTNKLKSQKPCPSLCTSWTPPAPSPLSCKWAMLTGLEAAATELSPQPSAPVCAAKPQWACPHYPWADKALTSSFDLDLHLLTMNKRVRKPVYHKAEPAVGVSRAARVQVLWAQTAGVLCATRSCFFVTITNLPVSIPWEFRRSQIAHSKWHVDAEHPNIFWGPKYI